MSSSSDKEQTEGNARLYRAACLFLTLICLNSASDQKRFLLLTNFSQYIYFFKFSLLPDIGCKQCAEGWLTFGRSCFFLSTFRLRWSESQQNCTSRGGSLAVITSKDLA
uniref:C-type lectin domain-containing protein n=1 Tax=Amphilophus citrinellus TaxID=61819 RepID=A0A3Q0T5C6_AMPCI